MILLLFIQKLCFYKYAGGVFKVFKSKNRIITDTMVESKIQVENKTRWA